MTSQDLEWDWEDYIWRFKFWKKKKLMEYTYKDKNIINGKKCSLSGILYRSLLYILFYYYINYIKPFFSFFFYQSNMAIFGDVLIYILDSRRYLSFFIFSGLFSQDNNRQIDRKWERERENERELEVEADVLLMVAPILLSSLFIYKKKEKKKTLKYLFT